MSKKSKKELLLELEEKQIEYLMDALDSEEVSSGTLNAVNALLKQNNIKLEEEATNEMIGLRAELEKIMGEEILEAELINQGALPSPSEEDEQFKQEFLKSLNTNKE